MQFPNELPNQQASSYYEQLGEYYLNNSRKYYLNVVETMDLVTAEYYPPAEKDALLQRLRKAYWFLVEDEKNNVDNKALKDHCTALIKTIAPEIDLEVDDYNYSYFQKAAIKRDLKSLINHCNTFVSLVNMAQGLNWELAGKSLTDLMESLSQIQIIPENIFKDFGINEHERQLGLEKMALGGQVLGVALPYLQAFSNLSILIGNASDNPENYKLAKEIVLDLMSGVINVLTWVWLNTNDVKVGAISLKDIGNIVNAFGAVVSFLSSTDDVVRDEQNEKVLNAIKELEAKDELTDDERNTLFTLKNQQIESNTLSRQKLQALVMCGLSIGCVALSIAANLVPGVAGILAATIAVSNFTLAAYNIICTHALEIHKLNEKKEVLQRHIDALQEGKERTDFENQLEVLNDTIDKHYTLIFVKLALNLVSTALNFLILNVAVGAAPWLTMCSNILVGMGVAYFEQKWLQPETKAELLEEVDVLQQDVVGQDIVVEVIPQQQDVLRQDVVVDVIPEQQIVVEQVVEVIPEKEVVVEQVVEVEEVKPEQQVVVEQIVEVEEVIPEKEVVVEQIVEVEEVIPEKEVVEADKDIPEQVKQQQVEFQKMAAEQAAYEQELLEQAIKQAQEKLVIKSSDRPSAKEASASFKQRYTFFKQKEEKEENRNESSNSPKPE